MYTIYDHKSQVYSRPFFLRADGEAMRAFKGLANDRSTDIGKYPTDYTLYLIGEFHDRHGQVDTYADKKDLAIASALVIQNPTLDMFNGEDNAKQNSVNSVHHSEYSDHQE